MLIKLCRTLRHRRQSLDQLLEQTREQIDMPLLLLPSEVAVYICDPDIGVISEFGLKLVDNDSCAHCLAGSRDARAE